MELSYAGLRLSVPETVYQPAEDSFMLAEAAKTLRGAILDMGCGCGIASLTCAKNNEDGEVVGVDINPEAVSCAKENARQNKIKNAHFIESDRFSHVPEKKFDALLFNPPYLPTSESERLKGPLNHAFDGGKDGRKVLDRFLDAFDSRLKPRGALLLVQSSLNGMQATLARLEGLGYEVTITAKEDFFFECVSLIRAVKPQKP